MCSFRASQTKHQHDDFHFATQHFGIELQRFVLNASTSCASLSLRAAILSATRAALRLNRQLRNDTSAPESSRLHSTTSITENSTSRTSSSLAIIWRSITLALNTTVFSSAVPSSALHRCFERGAPYPDCSQSNCHPHSSSTPQIEFLHLPFKRNSRAGRHIPSARVRLSPFSRYK